MDEGVLESIEVFEITRAEVIEHDDFRSTVLEVLDEVGADETGAAGDEDFHGVKAEKLKN
jgi:hypothetical protein